MKSSWFVGDGTNTQALGSSGHRTWDQLHEEPEREKRTSDVLRRWKITRAKKQNTRKMGNLAAPLWREVENKTKLQRKHELGGAKTWWATVESESK
jgi:hypothetical protein